MRVIDCVVDLGFKLTRNLDPGPHIATVSSRPFKVPGLVMRLSKGIFTSEIAEICVSTSYFRVRILWDPYTVSDSDTFERVQRTFLRLINVLC